MNLFKNLRGSRKGKLKRSLSWTPSVVRSSISTKESSADLAASDDEKSEAFNESRRSGRLRKMISRSSFMLLNSKSNRDNSMEDSSDLSSSKMCGKQSNPHDGSGEGYLLDRLGGMTVLHSIVMDFLNRVGSDDQLLVFFEGVDFRILWDHQKRFFAMAFTYVPETISVHDVIKGHHQHLFARGLNETHFDRVAQHLVGALTARGFNDAIIAEVVGSVAPLRRVFEEGAAEAAAEAAVLKQSSVALQAQ